MPRKKKLRLAIPAWEIGRAATGLGVKIGGLAVVIEELPAELVRAASAQGIDLEIETLTPCFAHYDKSRLQSTGLSFSAIVKGIRIEFEVYKHTFPDGQTVVYFWDHGKLHWTNSAAIYPDDPEMALELFSAVSQAMAGYINHQNFDAVHGHDYHVGLVTFYLPDDYLVRAAHHFTIHNASFQGIYPAHKRGFEKLQELNLAGDRLFHKYFDFFDNLNLMKAVMLKSHESGGRVTTVSGDLDAEWGYAAELKRSTREVSERASRHNGGHPVGEVFVPNRHVDLFEKLPVAGITNGMNDSNRPEHMPELGAAVLRSRQADSPNGSPIFRHPQVQREMLEADHHYNAGHLQIKADLKRLLHLEAFGSDPMADPVLMTCVGRLVEQKNLGLVAESIERTVAYDAGVKFVILAAAVPGEQEGLAIEGRFRELASRYPQNVYFNNSFSQPLSKLILAGGDFSLIPSRFEPCGLVDYEACLLGTVVIGHRTGGLAKVAHCAYLYEWLDIRDRAGEAGAFFEQMRRAIDVYRRHPGRHQYLIEQAMAIDASWDRSAGQYIEMYRFGQLMKKWQRERSRPEPRLDRFEKALGKDRELFARFFRPAPWELLDLKLRERLQ